MISIIIPVHNGAAYIKECFKHIKALAHSEYEVIVVDDGSSDGSRAIAKEMGFTPLCNDRPAGPAASRNLGAGNARGEVLFFVDSDVYLKANTLQHLESLLNARPDAAGVVFIYSLEHPNKGIVSRYKNFSIRTEEMAKPELTPCFRFSAFAIKKEAFRAIGGIDDAPCCEELEFGLKLAEHNLTLYLDKEVNVIHAKRYSLWGLLKGDFLRAYNYFKILFANRRRVVKNYAGMKGTFHLPLAQLLGVGLAGLFLVSSFFYAAGINLFLFCLAIIMIALSQAAFLKSACRAYGLRFAWGAFFLRNLEILIGEAAIAAALAAIFFKRHNGKKCLLI